MTARQALVGRRVVSLRDFASVPAGTVGVIDEDYGTGVMVAWDLPDAPLPEGYRVYDGRARVVMGILRDGFDKSTELQFLEVAP